jgi:predicted GH43/DUF377 family glycosyl hydrolase
MFSVRRSDENPLLKPFHEHPWEAHGAFNWCPIIEGSTTQVVYRALSEPDLLDPTHRETSCIGYAQSKDGMHYEDRRILIRPSEKFDAYGCEDPRITLLEGTHYIFYTALSTYPFSPDGIKVALATSNDLKTIDAKHLVTPFNAKAMALFPEKVNGRYAVIVAANTDLPPAKVAIRTFDAIDDLYDAAAWEEWYAHIDAHTCELPRADDTQTEVGAVPILTEAGWLLIYSRAEHYYDADQRVFGIEAALLDRDDPRKVIAHTAGPFMVPETYYEKTGMVKSVVFPSGAAIRDDTLTIFYGSTDMYGCTADLSLSGLLDSLVPTRKQERFLRAKENPIIAPRPQAPWEAHGTFNPAAINLYGKTHIIYRAQSAEGVSVFGYASSSDGIALDERLSDPVYVPRESFEMKQRPGFSGCEDPRIVRVDETLYMTYTAFDGNAPRVAATSISVSDFVAHRWNWAKPVLITPAGVDEKDTCIIPREMHDGSYLLLHRVDDSICADRFASLDLGRQMINTCIEVMSPRRGMWDGRKIGIAAPPLETEKGWLLLYHGVSESGTYSVGAALLDRDDPTVVVARTALPMFEPQERYEKEGPVPNVVFPCGATIVKGIVFIYYGGADLVTGVASVPLSAILSWLI